MLIYWLWTRSTLESFPRMHSRHCVANQAMRLCQELSMPWREIARVMVLHVTTVFSWAQRYAAEVEVGLILINTGRSYLSGRTWTLPQEWVLRTILTTQTPSTRDLPFTLLNRRAVRDLIEAEFGIDMPIRTVSEYLIRWGYTPQRPIRRALEQKPWDVQCWIQGVAPALRPAEQSERILQPGFQDTVALRRSLQNTKRTTREGCSFHVGPGQQSGASELLFQA